MQDVISRRERQPPGRASSPPVASPSHPANVAGWLRSLRRAGLNRVVRRVLTTLIAASAVVTMYHGIAGAVAERLALPASFDWVWVVPALLGGAGVWAALAVATAADDGLERAARLGLPAPRPEMRSAVNAVAWGSLGVLAVRYTAEAFEPFPGGAGPMSLAVGAALAVGMYRLHARTIGQDATRTFNLVAMVLAAGSVAAMSATGTGDWWTRNFSTLGTSDDLAAVCFNVAVIAAGAGIVVMTGALSRELRAERFAPRRGGVAGARVFIAALGASLMGVGIVPIDTLEGLHNLFACGAAAAFAVLSLGVRAWARRMPVRLVVISDAFFGLEASAMVLYDGLHVFNLTVFEIVAFSLVVAWLIALVACTTGAADAAESPAPAIVRLADRERHLVLGRPALALGSVDLLAAAGAGIRPVMAPAAPLAFGETSFAPPRVRHRVEPDEEPPDRGRRGAPRARGATLPERPGVAGAAAEGSGR